MINSFKDKENLLKVLKYVVDNSIGLGVNLQILTRFYLNLLHIDSSRWSKEYRKAYMRLYRFFKSLSQEGIVEFRKANGLIWVKATDKAVDLIFYARKTQTRKTPLTRKRLNEWKYTAKKYVSHKHTLQHEDWEYLYGLFREYIEDTKDRVLVFLSPDRKIALKPYSHRFQVKYLRNVDKKFDRIFANASKKYRTGVFITLTLDPKKFRTLDEAVKITSKAWNRFMSYLRKKFGFRPPYIRVLEFQNKGYPHLHVVIFGVDRIMDHYELTEYLKRIGFGEIHFEYQIVNRNGNWTWKNPKKKPTKMHNLGVNAYLKKYIKKVFYSSKSGGDSIESMKISLYFALDTRFFTYSRSLYKPVKILYSIEYGWVYIGSYRITELPDWIYNRLLSYDCLDPPPLISQILNI